MLRTDRAVAKGLESGLARKNSTDVHMHEPANAKRSKTNWIIKKQSNSIMMQTDANLERSNSPPARFAPFLEGPSSEGKE